MKIKLLLFTIVLVLFSTSIFGQATLPITRTAWTAVMPTGWTHTGTTDRTGAFACSGGNAETFDTTGDRIVLFLNAASNQLTFNLKKASMSGASSLLVEQTINQASFTIS